PATGPKGPPAPGNPETPRRGPGTRPAAPLGPVIRNAVVRALEIGALVGEVLAVLNGVASSLEACDRLKDLLETKTRELQSLFRAWLGQFVEERKKIADQIRRCRMTPACLKEAQDMYQRLTNAINVVQRRYGVTMRVHQIALDMDCNGFA